MPRLQQWKALPVGLLVVLLALVGVGVLGYYYARTVTRPTSTVGIPKAPAVFGTLQTSTEDSVVILLQEGEQKTFALSSTTQVISQVKAGETGKSLAEFPAGTPVLVQPSDSSTKIATRITISATAGVTNTNPAGPPVTLVGAVVATTTNSLTIKTDQDPGLVLQLADDTVVLSNVEAGHRGMGLSDADVDMYVQVSGYATSKGLRVSSVLLLTPLLHP